MACIYIYISRARAHDGDTHGCPATPPETDARHRIRKNAPQWIVPYSIDLAIANFRHLVKKREAVVSDDRSDVQANKRKEAALATETHMDVRPHHRKQTRDTVSAKSSPQWIVPYRIDSAIANFAML